MIKIKTPGLVFVIFETINANRSVPPVLISFAIIMPIPEPMNSPAISALINIGISPLFQNEIKWKTSINSEEMSRPWIPL